MAGGVGMSERQKIEYSQLETGHEFIPSSYKDAICLPPGTIHVSQEFDFLDTASIDDTFTSCATVSKNQSRGKFHLLVVGLNVINQHQKAVLSGKTSFILPASSEDM